MDEGWAASRPSDGEGGLVANSASSPSGHRLIMEKHPEHSPMGESINTEIEERANYILGRLGLSWEELKGKRMLDIGAGTAEFGATAREKGINVVSLDRFARDSKGTTPYQKEGYVVGSADHLPFADESFDIVVSHASVPLFATDREEALRFINEIKRVLKHGGECRFGPVGLGWALFPQDARIENRFEGMREDEVVRHTSLKTTALLRELIPNLQNSTDDSFAQTNNFYSFIKEDK